jgi:hypothetical protein
MAICDLGEFEFVEKNFLRVSSMSSFYHLPYKLSKYTGVNAYDSSFIALS